MASLTAVRTFSMRPGLLASMTPGQGPAGQISHGTGNRGLTESGRRDGGHQGQYAERFHRGGASEPRPGT